MIGIFAIYLPSQKTVVLPEMTKYPQDDFKPYDDGRSKTEQVEAMFSVLESKVAEVKQKFTPAKAKGNAVFSFGSMTEMEEKN